MYSFAPNWKCVWISMILASGYWFLPHKNLAVLLFVLWFPYIAIAWYDYVYKCDRKLRPTLFPFGRLVYLPFKPDDYKREFASLPPEAIRAMDRVDHIAGWTLLLAAVAWSVWSVRSLRPM